MPECTAREIKEELSGHLRFDQDELEKNEILDTSTCIPCVPGAIHAVQKFVKPSLVVPPMYFGQYHPLTCISVARSLVRQVSSAPTGLARDAAASQEFSSSPGLEFGGLLFFFLGTSLDRPLFSGGCPALQTERVLVGEKNVLTSAVAKHPVAEMLSN